MGQQKNGHAGLRRAEDADFRGEEKVLALRPRQSAGFRPASFRVPFFSWRFGSLDSICGRNPRREIHIIRGE
jgi:hypothetical protein